MLCGTLCNIAQPVHARSKHLKTPSTVHHALPQPTKHHATPTCTTPRNHPPRTAHNPPPTTHQAALTCTPRLLPCGVSSFTASALICAVSSRVGASTRARMAPPIGCRARVREGADGEVCHGSEQCVWSERRSEKRREQSSNATETPRWCVVRCSPCGEALASLAAGTWAYAG